MSSTAVVLSLLSSRRETATESGQLSIAVLVFEDLAVVAMVLLVPMLGDDGGSSSELLVAIGTAVAVIAIVLVGARRVMPRLLEAVARLCSPEVFLLTVVAICFATAYLTGMAGVGVSLGAFLAGLLVSESRFSAHALGEILPLEIIFTAVFFLAVGMLLDPAFLVDHWLLVSACVIGVLVLKSVTGVVAARIVGVALPVAVASSVLRAQIGEFSFVLEQVGRDAGLSPLDRGEDGVQAFLAASVVLMILTPVLAPGGTWLGRRLAAKGSAGLDGSADLVPQHVEDLDEHVIVAGYGDAARELVPELRDAGVPFVLTTLSPGGALEADEVGYPVLRGDVTKLHTLEEAGIRRASLVVIGDDDPSTTLRIVELVRGVRTDLPIIARTEAGDVTELVDAGLDHLVTGDRAGRERLVEVVLGRFGLRGTMNSDPDQQSDAVVRLEVGQDSACAHTAGIHPVLPDSLGCQACRAKGDRWVHLRICMSCGLVGCCDDSPNRHARHHAEDSGHPVVRSFERNEQWGWCFVDELEP